MPAAAAAVADYFQYYQVRTHTYPQPASTSTLGYCDCLQLLLAIRILVAVAFHYPALEYQTKTWPNTRHDTQKQACSRPGSPYTLAAPEGSLTMGLTIGEI